MGRAARIVAAAFVMVCAGLSVSSAAAPPGPTPRGVTLLTINDVYRIEGVERGRRGGIARLRTLRRQLEREDQDLLVLHAGDVIFPSLLSQEYGGAQMIDVLNTLDGNSAAFDPRLFVTFGNHEFDKRKRSEVGILAGRVRESQFTWLSANVVFGTCCGKVPVVGGPNLRPYAIVEANGHRVGVFGLTTDETRPDYVAEIRNPVEVARSVTRELRKQGADLVIAVTHLSVEEDRQILEQLGDQGPDLIVGGHEHTRQHPPPVQGRYVLKADADATSALVVKVKPRREGPPYVSYRYVALAGNRPGLPDPAVLGRVRAWQWRHARAYCAKTGKPAFCLDDTVGYSSALLHAAEEDIRACTTNFGNWIADRARAAFEGQGAQIAFVNAGSLRLNQDLPPGPILRRDIEELFQYPMPLRLFEIRGRTLQAVVQKSIEDWPGHGRWLQISGFSFTHDRAGRGPDATGSAKDLVLVKDDRTRVPVHDDDTILAVANDFLVQPHGDRDGYAMLQAPGIRVLGSAAPDLKQVVYDALERSKDDRSKAIPPDEERRVKMAGDDRYCTRVQNRVCGLGAPRGR